MNDEDTYLPSDIPKHAYWTLAQIKSAFWKTFHKAGELFFDYLHDEDSCTASTECSWHEFIENLASSETSEHVVPTCSVWAVMEDFMHEGEDLIRLFFDAEKAENYAKELNEKRTSNCSTFTVVRKPVYGISASACPRNREKMWREECYRIVNELADLARLPRDPCPGLKPCIDKIRSMMDNRGCSPSASGEKGST